MSVFARRVLDALPLTVYTVDLDGRITSTNASWSRFAEDNGAAELAPERSVVGRSIFEAMADQGSREQIARAMALLRSGRAPVVSWEFPCSSPTEERVFLLNVSALHDESRAVSGFVFSTIDITPSHRSREALIDAGIALARTISLDHIHREVARQLRRAVRAQALVIAFADEDTAALRVAYASGYDELVPALEQRLSPIWLEALATGRVVVRRPAAADAAADADADADASPAAARAAARTSSPSAAAGDGVALAASPARMADDRADDRSPASEPDGLLELSVPMTSAEGVIGIVTVLADGLAAPQRLEEAERVLATIGAQTAAAIERAWLVQRVEHKRRLEAIGEVSAGVAHELRNPLFGISSAAQLLRFRSREDPVVERNVGRILREVERLNRMVTSLLEYGRPNAVRLAAGDPDAVWDDVLEGNRGRLEARGLALRRSRAIPPASCLLDAEQLAQVYVNILLNAADHAPEGTDLTLTSQTLPSGGWRCRLHNGGPAIPPEVLARVFEIFFSTKSGGTGIGLALCQRIMDEHRGTIGIESTPESGTVVTVWLPGEG